GRVGAAGIVPRRPTRTDAAMSQRFIDRVQEEVEVLLATEAAIVWAGGFRYASFLDDPRPLGVLFEDVGYRLLRLTLAFGETGAREGTVLLAVPAEGRGPVPPPAGGTGTTAGADAVAGAGSAGPDWGERMERAVLAAEVRLEAVLDRMSLPLAAVAALRPGALLPVAAGALSRCGSPCGSRTGTRRRGRGPCRPRAARQTPPVPTPCRRDCRRRGPPPGSPGRAAPKRGASPPGRPDPFRQGEGAPPGL